MNKATNKNTQATMEPSRGGISDEPYLYKEPRISKNEKEMADASNVFFIHSFRFGIKISNKEITGMILKLSIQKEVAKTKANPNFF